MSTHPASLSPVREQHEQETVELSHGRDALNEPNGHVPDSVGGHALKKSEEHNHSIITQDAQDVKGRDQNGLLSSSTSGSVLLPLSEDLNNQISLGLASEDRAAINTSARGMSNGGVKRNSVPMLPSPVSPSTSLPVSPIPSNDLKLRRLSTDSQMRLPRAVLAADSAAAGYTPLSPGVSQNGDLGEFDRRRTRHLTIDTSGHGHQDLTSPRSRPGSLQRAQSTPAPPRSATTSRRSSDKDRAPSGDIEGEKSKPDRMKIKTPFEGGMPLPSPMPKSIPLPPVSLPTYLQLELSSQRPSHQYIYRSSNSDFPYESSRVKIERLLNFLYLPFHLEAVLWFGMLACLDSWLYTFTILPLRLMKSIYILVQSWTTNVATEVQFVSSFIYSGSFRVWRRRAQSSNIRKPPASDPPARQANGDLQPPHPQKRIRHHRRTKSVPSNLMPDDKADILKGLLIFCTCVILLRFDASRMYHWIRGQSAIKLYVIYNVLEVCDRLFSALGQDVLECLFSREALERKPDGHSKILRPFWLFMLALVYTIIHSTALFYQVITLNVAVNAYSNALITLLLSNQFVEIKSTVFKKFEKENLFQLTCADVVERFQLWHMLIIIAARNIAETGSIILPSSVAATVMSNTSAAQAALGTNITAATPSFPSPRSMSSIVPLSFTLVPDIIFSLTSYVPRISHVLGPFVIVLGSEMFVDWLKHAYINKFNNTRPAIYDRFLDVLAKDYYTNAFGDQNLTKRLGLPVIPLSCLLIRASVQTGQMFMASWTSASDLPLSNAAGATLASIHEQYTSSRGATPTSTGAALVQKVDELLGGYPSALVRSNFTTYLNMLLIAVVIFLVALAAKLVLGMILLAFARNRFRLMKEREKETTYHVEGGRRIGGWGVVEVDEDKRRWIYDGDEDGLRALQEREERAKTKREREKERGMGVESFEGVKRYEMVAKRIW